MNRSASRLARLLSLLPYLIRHQDIALSELVRRLGAPAEAIVDDLDHLLLCGVPPYGPGDYVGTVVEGDRISIRAADHFRRPIRWTHPEILALTIALSVDPGGPVQSFEGHATVPVISTS